MEGDSRNRTLSNRRRRGSRNQDVRKLKKFRSLWISLWKLLRFWPKLDWVANMMILAQNEKKQIFSSHYDSFLTTISLGIILKTNKIDNRLILILEYLEHFHRIIFFVSESCYLKFKILITRVWFPLLFCQGQQKWFFSLKIFLITNYQSLAKYIF